MWTSRINELLAQKTRLAKGARTYTQQDVAKYCGVSRQTVSEWSSPAGVPSIKSSHTTLMCRFFGCTAWELWEHVWDDIEPANAVEDESEGQLIGV